MSTLFGVVYKGKKRIDLNIFERILSSLDYWRSDKQFVWSNDNIWFGNLLLNTTPQSVLEHKSNYHFEDQCVIISDSRLDYRRDLVQQLGEDWESYKNYPDNYLILKSYLKWGDNCVKHLYGDFAFAIWDDNKEVLFCARDHFGIRPIYYYDHPDYFVLSSDFLAFKELPGIDYQIVDEFIIDSICTLIPEITASAYNGVYKLEPAHFMKIIQDDFLQKFKYWDLSIQEQYQNLDEEQAIEGLKRMFIDSISNKTSSSEVMGVELSGGLDSSSIASCLANLADKQILPIYTFTHTIYSDHSIRPGVNSNLWGLIESVYESEPIFKLVKITGAGQPGCFTSITEYLEMNQRPLLQNFANMSDLLYEEAKKHGVRILFSGYGGDQGITQSGALYLYELAIQKNWKLLKVELKKRTEKDGGNYTILFLKYYVHFSAPFIQKLIGKFSLSKKGLNYQRLGSVAINKSLISRRGIRKIYHETTKRLEYNSLRQQQYNKFSSGFILERLESSYYSARKRRVEYRYPFLDVKLIEFFYSVKSEFKYKNGRNRYLFRMAMEDILDDRIRMIPEKLGAAIPNVRQRIIKDDAQLREIILESKEKNTYHFVDYRKLLKILDEMKDSKARKRRYLPPIVFCTAFSVILLQKWQREGKIDIGIKC